MPLEKAENVLSEEDVEAKVETKIESEDLIAKLRLLSEEYRDVLVMRYLDEMSIAEIANAIEKHPNNVRVLLYRAKKALKQITQNRV